ncbi:MAG: NAD(P)H-binding protein, partial [Veillonella sp.]|nr:NAD(P)H-binding protein [Veillonella sp.]
MKALVLGATGAVGRHIVESLIDNHEIQEIHVFVRRQVTYTSPKVTVHIVNFEEPREWAHLVTGDILFSAMGTNRKQAGSKEAQWT